MGVIGIDLGTTYSCVAAFHDNKHDIIKSDNGLSAMASFVSFTKNGRLIGDDAKEHSVFLPSSTIFDVKRIIGRRFDDEILQQVIKTLPFEVENVNGNPKIKVQPNTLLYPEEISAILLKKMKENAERYFKTDIHEAVITVPAHFNDSQRQATKDAGKIAGLNILRIINEPTAAALAYGIDKKYNKQHVACNVLVYDFGGGTFDVSIIAINNDIFEVKATSGDTNLGGNDVDECLVNHFANEFKAKYGKDLRTDKRAIRRLRIQCEKLKMKLSSSDVAVIDIDNLFNECDFYSTMKKTEFETMCNDIFVKTLNYVKDALKEAKMNVIDIQEVILVGGSTRIPKVQELVKNFFGGKELNTSLNPDEAVAIGAAVQASILDGSDSEIIGGLLLLDVNPLSLGIECIGGLMDFIIDRNTQIPVKVDRQYPTSENNQTATSIRVYEGEFKNISSNHLLGSFIINHLTPRPAGETKIIITFYLNTNGILHVTAKEKDEGKNNSSSIDIHYDKSRLSEKEIDKIISDAANLKEEELKWEKNSKARKKLEHYCNSTLDRLKKFNGIMSVNHNDIINKKCYSILQWLNSNMDKTEEEYTIIEKEVYLVCNPFIRQYL